MIVVAAALVRPDRRVLLQQRSPDRAMAGLWEFPGGKVEADELPEEALVRELREELGIKVQSESLRPACFASTALGARHLILLLYICESWSGEPAALDAMALSWRHPEEMIPDQMPPADRPLVELLGTLL